MSDNRDDKKMEMIPGLPQEIGLECLLRLPYTCHHAARSVCRGWRAVVDDRQFFQQRRQSGNIDVVACLLQSLPAARFLDDGMKPNGHPACRLTVFDTRLRKWDCLPPIPTYPDGLPLFCQLVGMEGKLVVMGGWDPASWDPVRQVFVYDFVKRGWRQGRDMPAVRSFFAAGALEGRVVVAGGHDENKNALRTAAVYDVDRDEWEEAEEMWEERDECEGVVVGGQFWVVSGYSTDRQGSFSDTAEVYEQATGQWRRVEGAWSSGKCPRGCVRVGKDGRVGCWSEETAVPVTVQVAVSMGNRALLTGSTCSGAPHGFFLVDTKEGQKGCKAEKIEVGQDFSGFVQCGCCVEI